MDKDISLIKYYASESGPRWWVVKLVVRNTMGEDVQFRAGIRVFEEESLNALENIGNDKEYEQSLSW